MCKDFSPNFGNKRTGCCIGTFPRLTYNFLPTTTRLLLLTHPPYSPDLAPCYSSLFPQLKIKLKGCHFYIIEVIEAESQAVLNTLTEHNFQDAFKK
jgi:hypothetical protein